MINARFLLVLLLGASLLGACSAGRRAASSPPLSGTGQEKVVVFIQSYIRAFNDRDVDGLIPLYAKNAIVHVSGGEDGYSLDRDQLRTAFEIKRAAWEKNDVHLVDFTISNIGNEDQALIVNVVFRVESKTWSGQYPVSFEILEDGNGMAIVKENKS